jgi:glycosyltransferase involved in cell wall biosynthesis
MRRVALVMPVHNEEAAIDETLVAILASTRLPNEIVIGDGGSTDGTVSKCLAYRRRGLDVRVVDNRARFPGAGRNAAACAAESEILLFCDFGNRVDPHWVERMVAPFEADPNVDFVIGMYYPLVKSDFEQCVACVNYPISVALQRMSDTERKTFVPSRTSPGGSSIACTRAIWERAGGFPEWLRTAEDKLFGLKLRRLGARTVFAGGAGVSHHMRSSLKQIFQQYLMYGRGDGRINNLSRHFVKLLVVYGVLLGLVGAGVLVSPWLLAAAAVLYGAYVWRAAVSRILRFDGGLRRPVYFAHALAILVVRDWGAIIGNLLGRFDWLFKPRYRRNYRAYIEGRAHAGLPGAASVTEPGVLAGNWGRDAT